MRNTCPPPVCNALEASGLAQARQVGRHCGQAPGALHHIIARGIERKRIFTDGVVRDNFLNRLGKL
ncbi:MAG: hypothetical protein U9R02_15875 [Thermodesulfobacteriota bacterium]|nr:hypothetical protein [Thermodesulfobacteriota bacterium]